jgi:hypothetical protein
MKGTIFIKDKKVTLSISETGKVPSVVMELISPQFMFDGDKVTIVESDLSTIKK